MRLLAVSRRSGRVPFNSQSYALQSIPVNGAHSIQRGDVLHPRPQSRPAHVPAVQATFPRSVSCCLITVLFSACFPPPPLLLLVCRWFISFVPSFTSELNDVIVHPEGSYTELEHLLMRLGLVTEIRPHASMQCDEGGLLEGAMGMEVDGGREDKPRRLGLEFGVVWAVALGREKKRTAQKGTNAFEIPQQNQKFGAARPLTGKKKVERSKRAPLAPGFVS